MTTITAPKQSFENSFTSLQTRFDASNKSHSTQIHSITTDIKFDANTIDEAKSKLIDLATEQKRLTSSDTFQERALRQLSKLPMVGNVIKESADSRRTRRMKEDTISGVVASMFKGLRKQIDELIEVEQAYIKLHEQTGKNIKFNEGIKEELDDLQSENKVPMSHHTRVLRLQTQTEHTLLEDKEFIQSLESAIIPNIQMAIQTILQKLPRAESNLLTNAALNGGIDKVLTLIEDTNEAEEISNAFVVRSNKATQETLLALIKMNTVSEEQLQRIEDNTTERQERQIAVNNALTESNLAIQKAHKKVLAISANAEEAHKHSTGLYKEISYAKQ